MCGLDPNGLCGCPRFAFSVQFRFVQATDKTGGDELRSSTLLTRRCFERQNTDTRTKASSCARDALAEGLPMTVFLRARRDLTLIAVSMDTDMGGGERAAGWKMAVSSSRSQSKRPGSPHLGKQQGKSRKCDKSKQGVREIAGHGCITSWKFEFPTS